jgi:acyl carrier protein
MMDRESIRRMLVDMLEADRGEPVASFEDDKNLREEVGLDSLDVVSMVSQIERQHRIRLTHEELQNLVTVGDVLNLLQSKLTAAAAA